MVLTISLACCHVASKVMRTRLEEGPREEMWRAEAEVDEEKRKKAYRKQLRRGDRPLRRWLAVREEVQRRKGGLASVWVAIVEAGMAAMRALFGGWCGLR